MNLSHEPWTPERQARLVTLAEAGLTGSEIAVQLETTRNAVMGRCFRTGVTLLMTEEKLARSRVGRPKREGRAPPSEGRIYAPDHPMRRKRLLGERAFTDAEIATAIAAHMAGLSQVKAARLIRASAQSMSKHWMKDPSLMAAGRELFEAARADAARRAAAKRELEAVAAEATRLAVARANWPILGRMPERHRDIMEQRIAGATLQQVGDAFGITRERVRQIEVRWRYQGLVVPGARPLNLEAAKKLLRRLHVPETRRARYAQTIGGGWA